MDSARPLFHRLANREAINFRSSVGGKRFNTGAVVAAFTGEFALNNPLGTFWPDYNQTGVLDLSEGPDAEIGGFDHITIIANGSAINVPPTWKNIGTDSINIGAGVENELYVLKKFDQVVYSVKTTSAGTLASTVYDIRSYGADPSRTALENRTAILAAISAANAAGGGYIYIPKGNFTVTKTSGIAVFILSNLSNLHFVGDGIDVSKITLQAGSYAGDTSIFSFQNCTNISFSNFSFDGNRFNHSVSNEQMHGIRTFDCSYVRCMNMRFYQLRGDGLFLLGNTLNSKIWSHNCDYIECGRSGITIQRLTRFLSIKGCYFYNVNDQSIDSEPTGGIGYTDAIIEGNFVEYSASRSIGVTLGGSGSSGIRFMNNTLINCGLFSTSLNNSKISSNFIQGPVALLESCDNVDIEDNEIYSSGKCINVYYQNDQPRNFRVNYNRCFTTSFTENIIELQVDGIICKGNRCTATDPLGTLGTAIIISAPTTVNSYYGPLEVSENYCYNANVGVTIGGSGGKKWKSGKIIGNDIKDLRAVKTIQYGVNLSGPAYHHFDELFIDKNSFDTTLSESNQIVLNAAGCSWYKIDSRQIAGIVDPEGVVAAVYNSLYCLIGQPFKYEKTVNLGASGWVEKNLQMENVIVKDELLQNPQASISTHVPDVDLITGMAWTNITGQHDCLPAGEATATTLVGGIAVCTMNTGLSNCVLQSLIRTGVAGNEYAGIVFRLLDANNYWAAEFSAGLDIFRLVKVVAGVQTVVASIAVSIPASADQVLTVILRGNTIAVKYNGGNLLTAYDAFNAAQTRHGFRSAVTSRYYFKDLKVAGV